MVVTRGDGAPGGEQTFFASFFSKKKAFLPLVQPRNLRVGRRIDTFHGPLMSDTVFREASAAPAAKLGAELRAARQNLGWELADLARSLRIRQGYLEAIEAGRMADLPGTTYALGIRARLCLGARPAGRAGCESLPCGGRRGKCAADAEFPRPGAAARRARRGADAARPGGSRRRLFRCGTTSPSTSARPPKRCRRSPTICCPPCSKSLPPRRPWPLFFLLPPRPRLPHRLRHHRWRRRPRLFQHRRSSPRPHRRRPSRAPPPRRRPRHKASLPPRLRHRQERGSC